MAKKTSEKLGVKNGMRSILLHADEKVIQTIDYPQLDRKTTLSGAFDYVHFFVQNTTDFHKIFPKLIPHLKTTGMLWVSWPKAGQGNTDLTLPVVIQIGYSYGLVESKAISIDTYWSALKFTHPKKGKTYENSYGKLPEPS
ncbi:hypothetical protein [Cytophaga hutchinsonii]|uniref:DUF3052 domain-containing protein n=1 Tax=Cytophaga hutchinsonii (strain ATCC 33406 / DSM 1761 / CIP 103989 / NBRC 15051 / NCIMB 9469 / D465) TaxID=269798 RepID=A0A6N4SV16_CYTH3|nr:hypothetical protein [Cytophaga hutchinsonii]ABG60097.1 conserved hypothetical protein [Cytophaga hutchinsonii ATCC 33406]SFX24239.1 hypothetical protein SAMN04487930_102206 [Cytophaga hutchinsonii ATCC 33406]